LSGSWKPRHRSQYTLSDCARRSTPAWLHERPLSLSSRKHEMLGGNAQVEALRERGGVLVFVSV
jgi:hypothetical protein